MDLFEYQAKELFAKHNVPTTPGRVTESPEDAKAIAEEIGKPVMVKAQVKAGGRGKAGGVKYALAPTLQPHSSSSRDSSACSGWECWWGQSKRTVQPP